MQKKTSLLYKILYFSLVLIVPQVIINKGFNNFPLIPVLIAMVLSILAVYLLENGMGKLVKRLK